MNPNQKWLIVWIDKDGKEKETIVRAVYIGSGHVAVIERTGGRFVSAKKVD